MQRMERVIFTELTERKHNGEIVSYGSNYEVRPGAG